MVHVHHTDSFLRGALQETKPQQRGLIEIKGGDEIFDPIPDLFQRGLLKFNFKPDAAVDPLIRLVIHHHEGCPQTLLPIY